MTGAAGLVLTRVLFGGLAALNFAVAWGYWKDGSSNAAVSHVVLSAMSAFLFCLSMYTSPEDLDDEEDPT